ncbi:hypothetical protein HBE96_06880 [Clostridium sp. P21]|uniref:Uncharacterized protein n=1 Tax=Clostridium muellerianum TaxID=2716538 RepID=A0A7Y0HN93_9CLOT|nr:hypothetical protein [Clostridium muellerianum]NMM62417.1 hypothetical protein [Clostridium muellerianum]
MNTLISENDMVGSGSTSVLITYTIILFTHHKYRQVLPAEELAKAAFKLPLYPLSSIFSGVFIVVSLGIMACRSNTRLGFIFACILYVVLTAIYFITGMNKRSNVKQEAIGK